MKKRKRNFIFTWGLILACALIFGILAGCQADQKLSSDCPPAPRFHLADSLAAALDGVVIPFKCATTPQWMIKWREEQTPELDSILVAFFGPPTWHTPLKHHQGRIYGEIYEWKLQDKVRFQYRRYFYDQEKFTTKQKPWWADLTYLDWSYPDSPYKWVD